MHLKDQANEKDIYNYNTYTSKIHLVLKGGTTAELFSLASVSY